MFTTTLVFLGLLGFFGICGFVLVELITRITRVNFSLKFEYVPVLIFVGLSFTELAMFGICFLYIDVFVVYAYFIGFLMLFCFLFYQEYWSKLHAYPWSNLKQDLRRALPYLFALLFCVFLFAGVTSQLQTSPNGDAVDHNAVIAMIISNHRFPTSYAPIDPNIPFSVFRYPPGFRVLGVFCSLLLRKYPILVTPIMGGMISCLIPLLISSAVITKTKSRLLFGMALLLCLLIPNGEINAPFDANDLTLGNLMNGTYPLHMVVMQVIGFFCLIVVMEDSKVTPTPEKPKNAHYSTFQYLFLGLTVAAIILTHYSFTFFPIAFLGFMIAIQILKHFWVQKSKTSKTNKSKWVMIFVLIIAVAIVGGIYAYQFIIGFITSFFQHGFGINPVAPAFLVESLYGIIILIGMGLFCVKTVLSRKWTKSDLFYAIFLVVILSVMIDPSFEAYFFITSYRCVIPLTGIAIAQLCMDIYQILTVAMKKKDIKIQVKIRFKVKIMRAGEKRGELTKRGEIRSIESLFLIAPMIISFLYIPLFLGLAQRNWMGPDSEEYILNEWIAQNIPSDEVILNDPSFEGLFLPSFKYQNVVFLRQLSSFESADGDVNNTYYAQRANRAIKIYQEPQDITQTNQIIQDYNISYIQVTGNPWYYDYISGGYKRKRYIEMVYYIDYFNRNPFLVPLFSQGTSTIYGTIVSRPPRIYPGTYSFAGDVNGQTPQGWQLNAPLGTGQQLVSYMSGHQNVVRLYDANPTQAIYFVNRFANQSEGTVEFWFRPTGNFQVVKMYLGNDYSDSRLYLYFNYELYAAGGRLLTEMTKNIWYHLRIEFNCAAGVYNFYLNGKIQAFQLPFLGGPTDSFNWLSFDTSGTSNPADFCLDAVGYSWDPNYTIGDNLHYE